MEQRSNVRPLLPYFYTVKPIKTHTTFKSLIGIAPSGHITFISQLYAGSISDRELTVRSGLLNLPFDQGDVVMADKGFTISDLLEPIGVGLNIPHFLVCEVNRPLQKLLPLKK